MSKEVSQEGQSQREEQHGKDYTDPPPVTLMDMGFAVLMVHLATIPITGTGVNPAGSFGAALVYNSGKVWHDQWIFWVGPLLGAMLAAAYHQCIMRAGDFKALGSFLSHRTT